MAYAQAIRSRVVSFIVATAALGLPVRGAEAAYGLCPGDCDGDLQVEINELITGVRIALEAELLSACPTFDTDGNGVVTIDNLLAGVAAAQIGCPWNGPTPTATATPVDTDTPAVTPTGTAEPTSTLTEVPTTTPTPTEAPVGMPSDLATAIDGGEVRLAWMNADPAGGYTHARVLRRLNVPVAGPADPEAEVIYFGLDANALHPLLDLLPDVPEQGRTYHYAVFACDVLGNCGADGAAAALMPTLPDVLRGGGYVLHWRHASADVCVDQLDSVAPNWWKSCEANCAFATARQLNDTGRAESLAIGRAVDILGIQIGRVLSSEYCRNFTTAELMDFGPPLELLPAITFFVHDEANRCANSYALLAEVPATGTNTTIIGHAGFPAPGCAILGSLAWAEAAVFKPDGTGGSAFVTRLTADKWEGFLPPGPSALSASPDQTHVRLTWINGPAYSSIHLLRDLQAGRPRRRAADRLTRHVGRVGGAAVGQVRQAGLRLSAAGAHRSPRAELARARSRRLRLRSARPRCPWGG